MEAKARQQNLLLSSVTCVRVKPTTSNVTCVRVKTTMSNVICVRVKTTTHCDDDARLDAHGCNDVAVRIELRIMFIPMLTHNHCTFNVSAHDERPNHGMGQIPCVLSLCFKAEILISCYKRQAIGTQSTSSSTSELKTMSTQK